ncbi:MAG TPA: sigma-70 family RNA polymerase sigma factor [Clostridia bacterium]|nr:sigma-70 family RNA polymerase sigma factor [Clostridia bacterium]
MEKKLLCSDECIEDIIKTYSDMVYKLALSQTRNRENADDVFQEVFLIYFRKNHTFENENHRKAWLIRVTINCSKNIFDSSWFKRTIPLEDNLHFETEENDVYFTVLKLPLKYRTIIHLFYYEDMSITQISNMLNMKESTIKSRLKRAREKLKVQLKGDYGDV